MGLRRAVIEIKLRLLALRGYASQRLSRLAVHVHKPMRSTDEL